MRFVLLLLLSAAALAEDRQVEIDLKDGTHLSGTLVDFGARTYHFKVGDKVIDVPEDKVAEIRFLPPTKREDVAARSDDEEKLQILELAAKQTRALYENGQCAEMEVIRAEFLAAQWANHLGRMSDAEFAKRCDEARARAKGIAEAALKSGAMSPAELAKIRLELIDFYKPLPKQAAAPTDSEDKVGRLVTDAFYHRPENRFELKERWKADLKGLYGCTGREDRVWATTQDAKMYVLYGTGKVSESWPHEPGLLLYANPFEVGQVLVELQNFMFGRFDVYSQDPSGHWMTKRWSAESLYGGLNTPIVADLDGDGHQVIAVAAFGGRGVQVHAAKDGALLWKEDGDVSGVCAVRRKGEKGCALVGYDFGKGVKVLSYGGRKEEEWAVQGARCIAAGDLDGDGDDEVICGESAPEDFFGQENRVVARTNEGKEVWAYNLPSGFGLREPNALWVGDLDGDGRAEVLIALSPGIMTRKQEKTYDCFLCLLDSQGRPAWISEPFKDAGKMSVGSFCAGISLADLDGDGKKQVILGILEQGVRCYDVVH